MESEDINNKLQEREDADKQREEDEQAKKDEGIAVDNSRIVIIENDIEELKGKLEEKQTGWWQVANYSVHVFSR